MGHALISANTEIEQQLLNELHQEFILNNAGSPKQYLESQFTSNQTPKYEFITSSQTSSIKKNNFSELTKMAKIRNELNFP